MTVRIRPAVAADAAAISRLGEALNHHEGEPTGAFVEAVVLRDGFGARREFDVLLAEACDRAVGYALFHDCYDSAHGAGIYLADLFVEEEARGRGVGRALVAAVAADARRRQRGYVWWNAMERNAAAHGFYCSLGAKEEVLRAYVIFGEPMERLAGENAGG